MMRYDTRDSEHSIAPEFDSQPRLYRELAQLELCLSKHQLMAGLGRNPRATMAFQGDPAWIAAHAEIFAASYLLVFIRRRIGSSICEGSKREPFRTRIYWFFQMS